MADRTVVDQFAALLPRREIYGPAHPLGCHRRQISDRIVFDELLQVLRFGCPYQGIAGTTCSATTTSSANFSWNAPEFGNVQFGVLIDNANLTEAIEREMRWAEDSSYERVHAAGQ
jgi:hypothetical protein